MSERMQDYPRLPMKGDDNSWFWQGRCQTCRHWRERDGGCMEGGVLEMQRQDGTTYDRPLIYTFATASCKRHQPRDQQ